MADPAVTVAMQKLLQAYRRREGQGLDFLFRPDPPRDDEDLVDAVYTAVDAANGIFDSVDGTEGDTLFVEGLGWTPDGPAMSTEDVTEPAVLQQWLEALARELTARGLTGTVTTMRRVRLPKFYEDGLGSHQLTAFIAYTVVDPAPDRGARSEWNSDPGLIPRLAERFGRAAFPDCRTFVSGPLLEAGPDASGLLARLIRYGSGTVYNLRSKPPRAVTSSFYVNGTHFYMVFDPAQPWQDRLLQCRDAALAFPEATDLAFVQYANPRTGDWDSIREGTPLPPHAVPAYEWRASPHLMAQFVHDARGVMLLTDAHLARAHDLTGWSVEALGRGRHLVQARDLASWYAQPEPDPDVLARARADLGEMILTPASFAAHPPPVPPR